MRNVLADLRAACLRSASTQKPAVSVLDSRQDSTLQVAHDNRDQSPGWAAKSKCMRDRNLGMSGSRETRVAPGSIGVRSRLPAEVSGIRTLVPARTRDPTLSKLMFPGDTEPEKSEIEPGVCGAL